MQPGSKAERATLELVTSTLILFVSEMRDLEYGLRKRCKILDCSILDLEILNFPIVAKPSVSDEARDRSLGKGKSSQEQKGKGGVGRVAEQKVDP